METENKKHDNSIIHSDANTQCGDVLTADEENIVVMVKTYSPLRNIESESDEENGVKESEDSAGNGVEVSFFFLIIYWL